MNFRLPSGVCTALQSSIIFVLLGALSMARAEAPKVFWHSQPVAPNETVAVQGHGFTANSRIDIQRLENENPGVPGAQTASLTDPITLIPLPLNNASNLSFVIPSYGKNGAWEKGVFAYRVRDLETGAIKLINAPEVWFMQGDLGSRATPGGWVGLFGNSLHISNGLGTVLALVLNGNTVSSIPARPSSNPYAQYFDLPANLAAGDYEVYLHNGSGGAAAWGKYEGFDTAPIYTFKIVSADADIWTRDAEVATRIVTIDAAQGLPAGKTWDAVFLDAINKVKNFKKADNTTPSGGTILVKAGTYPLTQSLALADHTILKGEGLGITTLQWNQPFATVYPSHNARRALVIGQAIPGSKIGTFAISDIALERTYSLTSQTTPQESVCIERAYTHDEKQFGYLRRVWCKTPNTAADSKSITGQGFFQNYAAVWLRATVNTEITDCVFDQLGGIWLNGQNTRNANIRIERNLFRWRLAPISAEKGMHNLIYSGNTEEMQGNETENGTADDADIGDFFGTFNHNQRDIYFAGNFTTRVAYPSPTNCKDTDPTKTYPICPALGLTLDGNDAAYFGKIASVQGTTLNLVNATSDPRGPGNSPQERVQTGAVVQIMGGRGAGQWRHLMSPILNATGTAGVTQITVDRPWDVLPDTTSWLGINDFQGRMIFYGNDFGAAPKLQSYFATHDVVIANNLIGTNEVAAGVPVWVGKHYSGIAPGWHTQTLDNTITKAGATMGMVLSAYGSDDPTKGFYPTGFQDNLPTTQVYRNNQNTGGGVFQIGLESQNNGFLLEKNTGLESIKFRAPISIPNSGVLRSNRSIEGNLAQQEEKGNDFPINAGLGVLLVSDVTGPINLARSGLASSVNDPGGWGRINSIDGNTLGNWGPNGLATSGSSTEPWLQVDLRHQSGITKVTIWPRTDANVTANVCVLVSPQAFPGNLAAEQARAGVFSQCLSGALPAPTTVTLPPGFVGQYARVWKSFAPGSGTIDLAEIEVYGGEIRSDVSVNLVASAPAVLLGDSVNFTATVINSGPNPANNVALTGLGCALPAPTLAPGASASCTEAVTADAMGMLMRTVNVSASEADVNLDNNRATASVNVRGLLSISKTGNGTVSSAPAGINCGADCTEPYDVNTVVTLTATANADSVFAGWDGSCSGTIPTCTLTMDASKSASAAFNLKATDLSLTLTNGTAPVNTESPIIFSAGVNNLGPVAATEVVLTLTLPSGVTGSAIPSQGSCTGTGLITCNLGTLPNGANATLTVTAIASPEGVFDSTSTLSTSLLTRATVALKQPDSVLTNNSAQTATTVRLACQGQPVTKRGTSGADGTSSAKFTGTFAIDVIHGLSGDDWIDGERGADRICGGLGNDNLYGSGGQDALFGEAGNDLINGGGSTDICDGGTGQDTATRCETLTNIP